MAALVWWFISLNQQNAVMTNLRMSELRAGDPYFTEKSKQIMQLKDRKTAQYVGEGSIFLLLILVVAVFVFRATRRQLKAGQQEQNFMMAITHELKTPIAIAQLNLETILKRKLDETQQQKLISGTIRETKRLNDLCNNILLTSQLESGYNRFKKEDIELSSLVADCVNEFKRRFPARQVLFESTEETAISGDTLLLQLLVNNLVENALKYSPADTAICISVVQKNDKAVLQVKDQGQGIPDQEKEEVFGKFYRIGDERTRTSKGTGLGLYLCRKIMNDHKGTISLTDNLPSGSVFTAVFRSA